jgi:translation elongation factor EF-Ts
MCVCVCHRCTHQISIGDEQDKWKTLVHTASIAPHQRRGEPVPQSLLDRVIQAHSYWTEQQAKPQSIDNKMIVSL